MGGSVAYVGVWPGPFKTVPMTGGGHDPFATSPEAISPAACCGCQPRPGCASVRNRSTMHRWCSSNAGHSDLTRGSDVQMYGDSAVLHDECFRSRLPRGRCTGGKGRETTEGGAIAVISTPSDNVENRPGTPRVRRPGVRGLASGCTPRTFLRAAFLYIIRRAGGSQPRERAAVRDRADGRAIRTEGGGATFTKVSRPVTGRYSPDDRHPDESPSKLIRNLR